MSGRTDSSESIDWQPEFGWKCQSERQSWILPPVSLCPDDTEKELLSIKMRESQKRKDKELFQMQQLLWRLHPIVSLSFFFWWSSCNDAWSIFYSSDSTTRLPPDDELEGNYYVRIFFTVVLQWCGKSGWHRTVCTQSEQACWKRRRKHSQIGSPIK